MEQTTIKTTEKKSPFVKLIVVISIVIPVLVAVLFKVKLTGYDFRFLPPIYATINGLTAVCLVSALLAIKNGKRQTHERLMKTCMILSAAFLAMYVLYHMTTPSTSFGGSGVIK